MRTSERYLGDGVYASFDGYQIWVRAERESGWHEIALEPPVLAALNAYADRLQAQGFKILVDPSGEPTIDPAR